MVMKIQTETTILAQEIQTLTKINNVIKKNQEKHKEELTELDDKMDGIPKVYEYGTLVMKNFSDINDDQTTDGNNTKLSAYYIMPRYDCDLNEHLKKFEGVDKV